MRLTSSHFVGRVGELGELELAAREAQGRCPTLVLLGGESGVGKTRLVDELERRLSGEMLVLRGEAVEQGDSELPYSPLLNALRPLVRGRDAALATLPDRLAPSSRRSCRDSTTPRRRPTAGDGSGQLRLFEALLELLNLLSERQPVVLVLEDMHWADRSTRTFVSFLARSLRSERAAAACSPTAPTSCTAGIRCAPLLAELDRLDRARRIDLEPFDRAELTEALADILGDAPARSWSSACTNAAKAIRSTPRSCSPPDSTAAAPRRRACAMRSCCGSSACRPMLSERRARSPPAASWTRRRSPR